MIAPQDDTQVSFLGDLGQPAPPRRGRTAPYQKGSETSRDAARVAVTHLSAQQREIMRVAYNHRSGFTRKTVERVTGMKTQTACPRLVELEHAGKIAKKRTIVTRPGGKREVSTVKSGRCTVYVLGHTAKPEDVRG